MAITLGTLDRVDALRGFYVMAEDDRDEEVYVSGPHWTLDEAEASRALTLGAYIVGPGGEVHTSEAERVRAALYDDPFTDDATYGALVEEAAAADERRSWAAEAERA